MDKEEYEKMIRMCTRCSICKWISQLQIWNSKYATICPAMDMYNFHSYSGGGKIILALSLHLNRIKLSENLRDIVYKCTNCGGCAISCKFIYKLEPLEIIMELREKLVEAEYGPMPKQQQFYIVGCTSSYRRIFIFRILILFSKFLILLLNDYSFFLLYYNLFKREITNNSNL